MGDDGVPVIVTILFRRLSGTMMICQEQYPLLKILMEHYILFP